MTVTEKYPLLGHKVRDKVTGFTGFATSAHETLTGMLQYGLSPTCKVDSPNEMPAAKVLDYHMLEKLEGEDAGYFQPGELPDNSWYEIGAEVRDRIVPENIGIVGERATFINGCVYYSVILRKVAFKNDQLEPKLFDSFRRFEVIGEGLNKIVKAQEAEAEKTGRRNGGPVRDVPQRGR